MRFTSLRLENFRAATGLTFEPAPGLTLLVAPNGTGKTTLLDAARASIRALLGVKNLIEDIDHRRVWPEDSTGFTRVEPRLSIHSTATWGETPFAWSVESRREPGDPPSLRIWTRDAEQVEQTLLERPKRPVLLSMPAVRFARAPLIPLNAPVLGSAGPPVLADVWRSETSLPTWDSLRQRWFELQIHAESGRARSSLATARAALSRAIEGCSPHWDADLQDVVVDLPDEGNRSVSLMSDGWRSHVATILAVALRCTTLNPGDPDAALSTPGVLLIDEIEQHLHPALQLVVVDHLRRAFPALQIIASTHSSLVLTDVGEGDRILRIDRDRQEIRLVPLSPPGGRDAAQVLTGDWFGLESTLDDHTLHLLRDHRRALRNGDNARVNETESQIRALLGRYQETAEERLVLSIVAELEADPRFAAAPLSTLRDEVLQRIRGALT